MELRARLIFVLPLIGILGSYFVDANLWDERKIIAHERVLSGTEQTAVQYQHPLHDAVLELGLRVAPSRSAGWFSLLYIAYYALGLVFFFEALYRLCRGFVSAAGSGAACLYYVAVMPMFWFDNWYHASDPWGAFVSVLIVRRLFDPKPTGAYYSLLFVSGFVWDKSVFFPLSRAIADLIAGRGRFRVACELVAGLALAGAGQVCYRLYFGMHEAGVGSLARNLGHFHLYLFGLAVLQGPALAHFFRRWRELPPQFIGLVAQIPAWLALYLAMNGFIWEYRAMFFAAMTYSAPLIGMFFDRLLGREFSGSPTFDGPDRNPAVGSSP